MGFKVSIIIVSYNSESFIEKCLLSLRANEVSAAISKNIKIASSKTPRNDGMGIEVIVFDNNSTDSTVRILDKFSDIKLIISNENLGFAKGNNLAVKEANGEYLFFLNPDTEIDKEVLIELVEFYERTQDAGIIAPKLIMGDENIQPSVRKLPTVTGAFKEYILGIKNAYSEYVPDGDNPMEVEMVYGAAMLIKKDLFENLSGFDEKYFLYYEDADFCKRVGEYGKKIYYYPGVTIRHLVGGTKSDQNKDKLNYESSIKYHGVIGAFFLQLIFLISRLRRKP